ncbi:MAG: alpha/beta fold hydrolase, partial [Fulvivirga sp.]
MNGRTVEQVIEDHKSSGKFITIAGVQTFVLDWGEGEPVFCIHGVPTSSYLYRKVLKELVRKGFRGIAIDLPGLGLSDRPENFDYSFSNFAHFCALATEELGLERFHLVIHDIGGPI